MATRGFVIRNLWNREGALELGQTYGTSICIYIAVGMFMIYEF